MCYNRAMKIDGMDMIEARDETLDSLTKTWKITDTLSENVERILDLYIANLSKKGI